MALSLPTSTPMATSTPMPTLQTSQAGAWYQNLTPVPSLTPTPQGTMVFPVLRTINEQEDGKDSSGTSDQPLLPLAAAALGTSVLLAAASRKEEKETLEGATSPSVKVSSLAALAGMVKTSFDGIWNEAVRISPADAPSVRVTTYYVGTEDPAEYLQRQVEMKANTATVVATGATSSAGKVLKKPSISTAATYQDYLYGTSTAKGVIGTTTGTANSGQKKTTSVANAKSTTTSTSSAVKTSSSTKATTTTSSGGVLNWISDTAKSVVNSVKSVVTTVAAAIPSTVNKVVNAVSSFVTNPVATVQKAATTVKTAVTSMANTTVNTVKATVATVINTAVSKASPIVVEAEESIKKGIAEYLNDQINDLGTLHDVVGKQAEVGIASVLNPMSASLGSIADPTRNPRTAAFNSSFWGGINAWGNVFSLTSLMSTYTIDAFKEGRWSDATRGLIGLSTAGSTLMQVPYKVQGTIIYGFVTTPIRIFTTTIPEFVNAIQERGEGKDRAWDVLFTGANLEGDILSMYGLYKMTAPSTKTSSPVEGVVGEGVKSYTEASDGTVNLRNFDGKTTNGVFVGEDGAQIPFSSGEPNPNYSNYIPASHVEGKAAIYMRENGITNGKVFHNNTNGTCPYCNTMLPTLLKEGSILEVVPPKNAIAPKPSWIDVPKTFIGNINIPKLP